MEHAKRAWPFSRHRGMALIYLSFALLVILAFASLSVDLGRVQLVKSELRRAADAAALYSAAGLSTDTTLAYNNAGASAGENTAHGTSVVLTSADIEYGSWNPTTRVFAAITGTGISEATAMRITTRRVNSRSTAVPMTLATATRPAASTIFRLNK